MPSIERLAWTTAAWEDYLHWQSQDRRQLRRINQLIQACLRDPFAGIGKPEPLRENLAGCWSRRIDNEHRLVYRLDGELLGSRPAGITTGKAARRDARRTTLHPGKVEALQASWKRLNWLDGRRSDGLKAKTVGSKLAVECLVQEGLLQFL